MERTIISFDYAIKYLLRDKANFDILSGFLTELLKRQVSVQEILESQANTDRKGIRSRYFPFLRRFFLPPGLFF